ncbi:hypothetical protein CSIRO_3543 [Bradyrhizobiaceae bacterium SG-6C]|nr:hypothetical protein CSIRO_3543 [Bradyrhizobiaceae bacterium SG-6C]
MLPFKFDFFERHLSIEFLNRGISRLPLTSNFSVKALYFGKECFLRCSE